MRLHEQTDLPGDPLQDQQFAGPQSLESLIAYAWESHPDILAASLQIQAAEEAVVAAAEFRDPRINVGIPIEPVQTAAGPQDFTLGLSQEIPRLSKLATRLSLASAKYEVATLELEKTKQKVATQIRQAYGDLHYATLDEALLRRQQDILNLSAQVAEARLRTNQIGQIEWLEATLAVDQLEQQLLTAQQSIRDARTNLGRAVGIHPDVELMSIPDEPHFDLQADKETYRQLLLNHNPQLAVSSANMIVRQIETELSCLADKQDPTLSATWIGVGENGLSPASNGDDAILFGLSMGLPVFQYQYRAKSNSLAARAREEIQRHQQLKLEQVAELDMTFESIQTLSQQSRLLAQQMIPSASQIYEAAQHEFSGNLIDFNTLELHRSRLLDLERKKLELDRLLYRQQANLKKLIGGVEPNSSMNSRASVEEELPPGLPLQNPLPPTPNLPADQSRLMPRSPGNVENEFTPTSRRMPRPNNNGPVTQSTQVMPSR